MTFYHFSAVEHPIGTTPQPDNWGRRLDRSRYWNPSGLQVAIEGLNEPWRLASEMTLEAIRAAEFSDRPSRLLPGPSIQAFARLPLRIASMRASAFFITSSCATGGRGSLIASCTC
jgi:hypothetical protein